LSRKVTHRIVRKNVGRIAKMLVMDSRVLARKFISIDNYSEISSAFWTFPDVKPRFSLYFISRAHHMSIILIPPAPLPSSLIFVSTVLRRDFFRPTTSWALILLCRNNNRYIFKLEDATGMPMKFSGARLLLFCLKSTREYGFAFFNWRRILNKHDFCFRRCK